MRRSVAMMLLPVVTLVATGCASDSGSPVDPTEIELGTADGGTTTLDDQREGLLVVNLWATWCGPCVAEMPVFEDIAGTRADVTVIGVNVGDSADEATAFAADLGITYTVLTDPDGRLQTALDVNSLPATAFISTTGEVVEVHQGAYTLDTLEAAIDGVLAEVGA